MYNKKEKGVFVISLVKDGELLYLKNFTYKKQRKSFSNNEKLYIYLTTNIMEARQWTFYDGAKRINNFIIIPHFNNTDKTVKNCEVMNLTKKILRIKKLEQIFQ